MGKKWCHFNFFLFKIILTTFLSIWKYGLENDKSSDNLVQWDLGFAQEVFNLLYIYFVLWYQIRYRV